MQKPRLVVNVNGPGGNIFSIIGQASALLKKEDAQKMAAETMDQNSYGEALKTIDKYVTIICDGYEGVD